MKKTLTLSFAIASCLMSTAGMAQESSYITHSERYVECTKTSRKTPQQSLGMAQAWLNETANNPAARHCLALSLFSLRRFGEASNQLVLLASDIPDSQSDLKAQVYLQAAHSLRLKGDVKASEDKIDQAILIANEHELDNLMPSLLMARAALMEGSENPARALQDYDHILTLDPEHSDATKQRQKLLESLRLPQATSTQTSGKTPGS